MAFNVDTLITDRTAKDVERWQTLRDKGYAKMTTAERLQWNGTALKLKGVYNYTDLNRVGNALNYLHDRLKEANYITHQTTFIAKTNWARGDIPTRAEFTHYLKCVSFVREAMTQFATTPPTPTDTGRLNYEEANNIEKILLDVETLINNMLAARVYCNDVFAGEL